MDSLWAGSDCCLWLLSAHTLTTWDHPGILSFSFIASYLPSLGLPAGILDPTHTAWPPRPSFEVWVEASMIRISLEFCMPTKINLTQMTQSLLTVWAVVRPSWLQQPQNRKGLRQVKESQRSNLLSYETYCITSSDFHSSWWEVYC